MAWWGRLLLLPLPLLLLPPGLCVGQGVFSPADGLGWGAPEPRRRPALPSERRLLEAQDLSASLLRGPGPGAPWLAPSLPADLPELEPECRELLLAFAQSSAELAECVVRSARPVRLCQNCYRLFERLAAGMDNISRAVGNTSESHNCAKNLLMSDRIRIVVILSQFFNTTWKEANCENCLTNNSEELSNSTVEFLERFNATLMCFENNVQQQNYTEVCKNCQEEYKSLNKLYSNMQNMNRPKNKGEPETHLCIDVEDAMNITRKLWSRDFNCTVPCGDTVPVIAVSVFILFLPVVFYLSSFLHSEQKKRKLIPAKRLKSSTSFVSIQENSN